MKIKLLNLLMACLLLLGSSALIAQTASPTSDNSFGPGQVVLNCPQTFFSTTLNSTEGVPTVDTQMPFGNGPLPGCGNANTAPGVWFTFQPNIADGAEQTITLSTCDGFTDFDTRISVFEVVPDPGFPLGFNYVCVAENDDSGCPGAASEVSFDANPGLNPNQNFQILVHGFGTSAGNFAISVSCAPPSLDNDACVDAVPVACGDVVDGTTAPYTFDNVGFCGTSNTAPGVWYVFEGDGSSVTASTCNQADYDTKISVFSGDCGGLTCIGGQDDASGCAGFTTEFTFNTVPDVDYYILVHGWSSATGDFTLSLDCVTPTGNDPCSGAEPIACGETISGSTSGASADFAPFCGTSNTAPGVWYYWTGDGSCVNLTTCNQASYDTKLTVYTGGCAGLTCVAGNDDDFAGGCGLTSTVDFASVAGTEYLILVHGFSSATGDFDLTLTCSPGPANDDACNAQALALDTPTPFDNNCASAQPGEASPGAGTGENGSCNSNDGWCSFETGVQSSIWYTFVAPASGAVNVAAPPFDTQLAIYSVGDCNDFSTYTEVGANDDGGPGLSAALDLFCLAPGDTYYVQLDGFGSSQGAGTITVTALPGTPLSADAGDCQTKFTGYEPAYEGYNYLIVEVEGGQAPYTYAWSGAGIVEDPLLLTGPTTDNIIADPSVTTNYTVVVTDANGCSAESSVQVIVENVLCSNNSNNEKITICHFTGEETQESGNSLCVSESAVDNHIGEENHGDVYGSCDNFCRATNPPPAVAPQCVDITVDLTTDNFGSETSWTLTNLATQVEVASGDNLSSGTNYIVTECVDPGCYEFEINDSFGDGICCSFGLGDYSVTYDGTTTASPSGGNFGSSEIVIVGDCPQSIGGPDGSSQKGPESLSDVDIQVTPNPFSDYSMITFIPSISGNAVIDIYDLNGSLVTQVFNADVKRGQVINTEVYGEDLGSNGIYFYRIIMGDQVHTGKLMYTH